MAHVEPRAATEVPALASVFEGAKLAMGFVPNSMLTMAHMPQLTVAFSLLANVVFGRDASAMVGALAATMPAADGAERNLSPELVQLVAFASSVASGCRYCQAHTSHNAHRQGATQQKLDAILAFETTPLFTPAERAAIALAMAAGRVPNEATAQHFATLREHFDDRQIVQIVAVIALFGFLNRWNDTMATALEAAPAAFAQRALDAFDWRVGKHGAEAR